MKSEVNPKISVAGAGKLGSKQSCFWKAEAAARLHQSVTVVTFPKAL